MSPRRLADDVLDVDAMVRNILQWWQDASPEQRAAGETWYADAWVFTAELAAETGHAIETVAAVVAALSPRTSWRFNKIDAQDVLRGRRPRTGVLGDNLRRAQRVLLADDPVDELTRGCKSGKPGGPKIHAFAWNILGDQDRVTVDTWAARAAIGVDGDTAGHILKWVGAYELVSLAYRKAAAAAGVTPAVMQATVWTVIRGRSE